MKSSIFFIMFWSLISLMVRAEDIGSIQRSIRSNDQPMLSETAVQALPVEQDSVASKPIAAKKHDISMTVRHIQLQGNRAVASAELVPMLHDVEGKETTLQRVRQLVEQITRYYHEQGYLASFAYLPPQTIGADGILQIDIVEGVYGNIRVNNHSAVRQWLINRTLQPLASGQIVRSAELNQRILLLRDIEGIRASGVLNAGEKSGESDLSINITPTQKWQSTMGVELQKGQRQGVSAKVNAQAAINNLLGLGDVLRVYALTSGKRLNYLSLAGAMTVNGSGTKIGLNASGLRYSGAAAFQALDLRGYAIDTGLWVSQPLLRSTMFSIDAKVEFGRNFLLEHQQGLENRRRLYEGKLSIEGVQTDAWGSTTGSLFVALGRVSNQGFRQTGESSDNSRRMHLEVSRSYLINENNWLQFSALGQIGSHKLDSSVQFQLGGKNTLRSYTGNELYGNSGFATALTWNHRLSFLPVQGALARAYFESGAVSARRSAGLVSAYGFGLGLDVAVRNGWTVGLDVALPIGAKPPVIEHRDRFNVAFVLNKQFH